MAERRRFPLVPGLLVTAVICFLLYHMVRVLIPFALGFAVAYVANPIVSTFELKGLRRWVSVATLFLAVAGAFALAAGGLTDLVTMQFSTLQSSAPKYLTDSKAMLEGFEAKHIRRIPAAYRGMVSKEVNARLYDPLIDQVQKIPAYVLDLFPVLSMALLVPFITFFFLIDGPGAIDGFIQACPSRYVEQALHLISEIDASLGSYLRGLIIEALAITAASFTGLLIMDVNQALAIAVIAGVFNVVPYLGPALGAVVGGLVALFQYGTIWAPAKVLLLFAAVKFADDWVLQPIIAKHSTHLHALTLLASLMVGEALFGIIGMLFAVPVVCVLRALIKVIWTWYSTESRFRAPELLDGAALPYT
ncbi:MAG: AI-2E family transporter [Elusimicrobia bacterium]|nr:AI-2E family transporter [Elusimicrobiota bacterium]